jgi:hypothetical protein
VVLWLTGRRPGFSLEGNRVAFSSALGFVVGCLAVGMTVVGCLVVGFLRLLLPNRVEAEVVVILTVHWLAIAASLI